jgi:hypothetical protein
MVFPILATRGTDGNRAFDVAHFINGQGFSGWHFDLSFTSGAGRGPEG